MSDAIKRLRHELDEALETIRQLRAQLVPTLSFPPSWCLTPKESALLAFLVARSPRPTSHEQILDAIYQGYDEAPQPKLVDVYIFRLRGKLAPVGVEIRTHRGFGFFIAAEQAKVIRQVCGAEARGENMDGVTFAIFRAPPGSDVFFELSGEISSPDQLDDVIATLREAAARAWPTGKAGAHV